MFGLMADLKPFFGGAVRFLLTSGDLVLNNSETSLTSLPELWCCCLVVEHTIRFRDLVLRSRQNQLNLE